MFSLDLFYLYIHYYMTISIHYMAMFPFPYELMAMFPFPYELMAMFPFSYELAAMFP